MADIMRSPDCGNSPKNQFAQEIAIALETADRNFLGNILAENVSWEKEDGDIVGCQEVLQALDRTQKIRRLHIDHVVSHGKAGAVNGVTELEGSTSVRRFCHVLTFTSTRCNMLARITSF